MQEHLCVYIIQLHRLICKTADGVKREAVHAGVAYWEADQGAQAALLP